MFLIACALEQESRGRFEKLPHCEILYTGLGKINATMSLTQRLMLRKYDYVINLGTVGSLLPSGQVFQVDYFIQRDMLAFPLAPNYYTPFDKKPGHIKCVTIIDFIPRSVCGTGDSFVSNFKDEPYFMVDMEGYALAKVCRNFKVPFISLKYVTDSGEAESWENRLEAASIALHEQAERLLYILPI